MDLSKVSDDDLKALYARQTQAQRAVQSMTDDELRAAAYVQPQAPPGVTVHTGQGDIYSQGGGKFEPTNPAEAQARAMRERDGALGMDVPDSILRGIPFVGAGLERGRAALTPGDYGQNLQAEQARSKTYDADYPIASTAGKVAGGVGATLAAAPLAAGSRAIQFGFGIGGKTLPQSIIRGVTAGGLQGATQGAGDSSDLTNVGETAGNAVKSGGLGAALGGFIPAAVGAGGVIVDRVRNAAGDALSSLSNGSQKFIRGQLGDPAQVAAQRAAIGELGPNGMLADVSPEWGMVARGAAARPGSRSAIVDALNTRDAGKNARIGSTIDTEFGAAPIPSAVQREIDAGKKALSPAYTDAFKNAKAVDTAGVAAKLEQIGIDKRGAGQKTADEIRSMLNLKGTDHLDPNPKTLHEVRMAIDGMARGETDSNVQAVLTSARKLIDEELAAKVPGIKPIDAQYAALQRQEKAFDTGQRVFETGRETVLRPQELSELQDTLRQPAGTAAGPPTRAGLDRLSDGTRAELDRIVGTNSNDVAKLNTVLKSEGDWNRDKLRLLFGQEKADRVLKVLDAEKVMENTRNRVTGGSDTAPTKGFSEFLNDTAKGREIPAETTAFGAVARTTQKLVNSLLRTGGEEKASRIADELGRLAVATGTNRDAIIQALMQRNQRASTLASLYGNAPGAGASSPLVDALMNRERGDRR